MSLKRCKHFELGGEKKVQPLHSVLQERELNARDRPRALPSLSKGRLEYSLTLCLLCSTLVSVPANRRASCLNDACYDYAMMYRDAVLCFVTTFAADCFSQHQEHVGS